MRAWLQVQRRCGSSQCADTEARLMELCEHDELRLEDSEEEDEEEEVENSEPLEDSDIQYSDSGNTHTHTHGVQSLECFSALNKVYCIKYCSGTSVILILFIKNVNEPLLLYFQF